MTAGMPLLPSALPPKGEASHYGANNFLNLIALPIKGRHAPRAHLSPFFEDLFMEFQHTTVLLHEMIDRILTDPHGIYVDCTLGGGGHSFAMRRSSLRMRF